MRNSYFLNVFFSVLRHGGWNKGKHQLEEQIYNSFIQLDNYLVLKQCQNGLFRRRFWCQMRTFWCKNIRIYNSIIQLDDLVRNSYHLVLKRCQCSETRFWCQMRTFWCENEIFSIYKFGAKT